MVSMDISGLLDAVNVHEVAARSIFERGHENFLRVLDAIADCHFQKLTLGTVQQRTDAFDLGVKLRRGVELETLRQNVLANFITLFTRQNMVEQLAIRGGVSVVKAAQLGKIFEIHF